MKWFGRSRNELVVADYARTEEVHMSLVQMRTALNALPMGVVIVSSDGSSRWSNRAVYGIFVAGSEDQLKFNTEIESLLSGALHGRVGKSLVKFGDSVQRTFEVQTLSLIDGGAVATVEEITQRLLTDSVRTDFVANISHELRTPIGAISLLAENIAAETQSDTASQMASHIVTEASRLANTVGDLLKLAQIEFEGLAIRQQVSVPSVMAEAVDRMKFTASAKAVKIDAEVTQACFVLGDHAQLVSAVSNLIDNAIKFSEPGSSVEVVSTFRDGQVTISISDHGLGIAPEHQARVFERFYRVDDSRSRASGGTGLGLAIVRHIARIHGGEATVFSPVKGGSIFTLSLPAN